MLGSKILRTTLAGLASCGVLLQAERGARATGAFTIADISVGQHIDAFGTANI